MATDDLPAWLEAQADGWGWLDTESPRRLRAAADRIRQLEDQVAQMKAAWAEAKVGY